ncbi:MAG: GHKL domain-containing protein [Gammaproteobacteria bacterium]|nr:GHKL domain-containing protein [Gammaproteobacteria bacterium]
MEEACSSGNSTMKNHTHIDAYGEKRHYEVHCVPVHNPKIGSHQVLEFFIDVTERHYRLNEKEREIRQQTQLFDTFRSTAHTMKNSIGYLNGMVDHVAAVKERTGELGELLSPERVELIREQVTTIMSLLLLALRNAKGDANRVAVLSVQKKIDEVLSLFAISTLGKGKEVALQLNVEHEVCIRLPAIDCQTMQINLLNNAADAVDQYLTERATAAEPEELMALMRLQEEPMITLEVTQRKELLFIEISNLAKPIPMEVLPTIFEKGFSTKESGNGVGLYDVRQIIKQAGGDISVSNQEDGVTFALNLPLVDCDTTKNGP